MSSELEHRLYSEIRESIRSMLDSASRLDERIKQFEKRESQFNEKIDDLIDAQNNLIGRIMVLESQQEDTTGKAQLERRELNKIRDVMGRHEIDVSALKMISKNNDNKLKNIFDYIVKTAWIIFLSYIAVKFGLSQPVITP